MTWDDGMVGYMADAPVGVAVKKMQVIQRNVQTEPKLNINEAQC